MVVILVYENFFCDCDFGYGKFFVVVILIIRNFWTCDFGYKKFLDV